MGPRGVRRVMLAAAVTLGVAAPAARANELVAIPIPARQGEVNAKWADYRTAPLRAHVLLPDGYDPAKAYPLLVLLHGASSNYRTWSAPAGGNIKHLAAGFPGIIVMPEGGTGMYVDWYNGGRLGDPAWESYELDEVIPQVLERYRIRPERRYHALAGVSMGGLGTAYLGGRLPGFFGSIALISGVLDTHLYPFMGSLQSALPQALAAQPLDLEAAYGPADGPYAWGHDPVRLAANLQHTRVFQATGNGVPTSDGEPNGNNVLTDVPIEALLVRPSNKNYVRALRAAGVDVTYEPHDGIHDFANFRREVRDAFAWGLFAPVEEHPAQWVNDTIATHGKLWEFSYRFDARPRQIVRFRRDGGRLRIGGAGSPVSITTDGGCRFRVETPAVIDIPAQPCATLALSVRPRRLRPGRPTRVRVRVTPAVAGAVVRAGRARAVTDATGVAVLRACAATPRGLTVRVRASDHAPARTRLPAAGRPRAC